MVRKLTAVRFKTVEEEWCKGCAMTEECPFSNVWECMRSACENEGDRRYKEKKEEEI